MNTAAASTAPSSGGTSATRLPLRLALTQVRARLGQGSPQTLVDELLSLTGLDEVGLIAQARSELGMRFLTRSELSALQPEFDPLQYSQCIARQCVVAMAENGRLCCLADPWRVQHTAFVAQALGQLPEICWARAEDIVWLLQRHADNVRAVATVAGSEALGDDSAEPEINLETIEGTHNPVVRFIDAALLDSWRSGASDIHFETGRSEIILKYRLDGVLVETGRFAEASRIEEVLNRIKIIAGLDISEQRVPQDGRFRARFKEKNVDFRVSIMPSIHGEDAVIRVLDKSHLDRGGKGISLHALGYPEASRERIRQYASEPQGMLLVTGPTGSGKTTTLYAVLSETRSALEKIITIEDPVEYELPGILQIPVNEKKGLTFSRGLRSILRHDPDRLLIGEIRDAETAEIAVQAALTGHGVLTSLHANNAYDAVNRFIHMGVDLYAFASAANAIISQRLLRRVCDACAEPVEMSGGFARMLANSAVPGESAAHGMLRRGRGCPQCRQTGYQGRFAVAELLMLDDAFRQLIIDRAPIQALKEAAVRDGGVTLRDQALRAVLSGQTTEEEFRRVVATQ